jgi:CheY-like chemotaxis protein
MMYPILIAEDNPEQIELLKIFLNRSLKECTFVFVKTGAEFLERLKDNYKIIVLDYILPDTTGLDLLVHCRQKRPEIPAIIITAYNDDKIFHHLKKNNVNEIILKGPNYYKILIQAIKNILVDQ